jgi:hypothetical protein
MTACTERHVAAPNNGIEGEGQKGIRRTQYDHA